MKKQFSTTAIKGLASSTGGYENQGRLNRKFDRSKHGNSRRVNRGVTPYDGATQSRRIEKFGKINILSRGRNIASNIKSRRSKRHGNKPNVNKNKGLRRAPKYCCYKIHQTHAGAIMKTYQVHAGTVIKTS
jgi:hypothetical protein